LSFPGGAAPERQHDDERGQEPASGERQREEAGRTETGAANTGTNMGAYTVIIL